MTALKIKNELMRIIIDTDDIDKLLVLKNTAEALQAQNDGLTEQQLKRLAESEQAIKEGRTKSNEEVQAKVKDFFEARKQ